ncbi:hypothetical protein DNTS_005886 [Danionella cerebrum]|uniref:Prolactin receptor n=1 Tax=Danionella cerebrum TaxID=2873325 RepID=A0A553R8Y0_9TELE|nr:hypothetical protein DNTS_005886 [Danionella translucida]
MRNSVALMLLILIEDSILHAAGISAPGKPRLTSCRSPEKETFTCWWEPGDPGGLSTTYALYYRKENKDAVFECPDYRTAGPNSCFFNRNVTSVWVNYNITVVATNALGRNISDPVEVDVAYIVQPNTPENVTAVVIQEDQDPFLRVYWEKPRTADTRSGWITLVYQLRVKQEKDLEWEEYDAGMQKYYNVFSLYPNKEYLVQVRCKPDHGFWNIPRERSMWIMITIFSVFIVLILTWTLNVKRNRVKLFLLPPVPGPKIKGFDKQLLKNGNSEDMFNSLVIPGFPPTTDYDDLLVEYLEVYDNEEQELVLDSKDLSEDSMKSKSSSDSDSGRGSCDSRTLLLEKCLNRQDGGDSPHYSQHGDSSWASSSDSTGSPPPEPGSPESMDGRQRHWRVGFSSPQPHHHYQNDSVKASYHSVPETLNYSPIHSITSNYHQLHLQEVPIQECHFSKPPCRHSQSYNQFNTEGIETLLNPSIPQSHSLEYVEVERVNPENMLLLRPLSDLDHEHHVCPDEDYSKVREVTSNNLLLLQRETSHQRVNDYNQDLESHADECTDLDTPHPCKAASRLFPQEPMRMMGNGYVDSAALMPPL